jgi:hypothetical protein
MEDLAYDGAIEHLAKYNLCTLFCQKFHASGGSSAMGLQGCVLHFCVGQRR